MTQFHLSSILKIVLEGRGEGRLGLCPAQRWEKKKILFVM